jgi:calcineurin-like phosphoesterase family protein
MVAVMGVFFTSDSHFGHKNVIEYCRRPFESVEQMNDGLIEQWNSVVGKNDTIYHLGDFGWFKKRHELDAVLGRLQGHIHLVRGNHDHKPIKNHERFIWVKDYYELRFDDNGVEQLIVMCHYPIESWNQRHRGAWHIHGHTHGSFESPTWQRRIDIGADCHNYKPISYEQLKEKMAEKSFKQIDHHV